MFGTPNRQPSPCSISEARRAFREMSEKRDRDSTWQQQNNNNNVLTAMLSTPSTSSYIQSSPTPSSSQHYRMITIGGSNSRSPPQLLGDNGAAKNGNKSPFAATANTNDLPPYQDDADQFDRDRVDRLARLAASQQRNSGPSYVKDNSDNFVAASPRVFSPPSTDKQKDSHRHNGGNTADRFVPRPVPFFDQVMHMDQPHPSSSTPNKNMNGNHLLLSPPPKAPPTGVGNVGHRQGSGNGFPSQQQQQQQRHMSSSSSTTTSSSPPQQHRRPSSDEEYPIGIAAATIAGPHTSDFYGRAIPVPTALATAAPAHILASFRPSRAPSVLLSMLVDSVLVARGHHNNSNGGPPNPLWVIPQDVVEAFDGIVNEGAYLIKYSIHGTPHERYFAIRMVEVRGVSREPCLTWSVHKTSWSAKGALNLAELHSVVQGTVDCPAFEKHLMDAFHIKGPMFGGPRRSTLSTEFTVQLLGGSEPLALLGVNGAVFQAWMVFLKYIATLGRTPY